MATLVPVRLRRPEEVPATAGVSGLVVVLALLNFGDVNTWRNESVLFGAWGLMYLGECLWRAVAARRQGAVGDV